MQQKISDAIACIYDAALDPARWPKALESIVELTGSKSGNLISSDSQHTRSNVAIFKGIDPDWIQRYNDYYYQFDPSMRVFTANQGRVVPNQVTANQPRDLPPDVRLFYNELMLPQDFHFTAGAGLFSSRNHNAAIILQRGQQQGDYESDSLKKLEMLLPHIRRSLQLHRRHQGLSFQHGLDAVYENSHHGVLLLDGRCELVYLNPRAEELLRLRPQLQMKGQRLQLVDPRWDRRLKTLLAEAARTAEGRGHGIGASLVVPGRATEAMLRFQVSPVRTRVEPDPFHAMPGRVLVYVDEMVPHSPGLSDPLLASYFDLTRSEAAVLASICAGMSLDEIAASRVRSIHTIRSQTKSIMKKLGAHRHADLVRIVLTSPVGQPADHTRH